MADLYIENSLIKVGINLHGAELVSLIRKNDNREYMWSGDAKYWGRVSPVLFPFVGKLNEQKYRYNGKEYCGIPQHGFARDCEFEVREKSEGKVWFELILSDKMQEFYPFECKFFVGYELNASSVKVLWKVINTGNEDLHFSIGAHPAFMCPGMDEGKQYYLDFNRDLQVLASGILNADGVLSDKTKDIRFDNGLLVLNQELFAEDALVYDGTVTNEVSILDENKNKFLSVKYDAPQLGIWSPVGKNAPFVCIEPWYGRCDRAGFTGDLSEREFGNTLKADEVFERSYTIEI